MCEYESGVKSARMEWHSVGTSAFADAHHIKPLIPSLQL